MSNAVDYTTVDAGQDLYAENTFTDDDGDLFDPAGTIEFRLQVGDAEESLVYTYGGTGTIVRVSQGVYRQQIDTTTYGGNWLWGQWLSTSPRTSQDWQAYVAADAA